MIDLEIVLEASGRGSTFWGLAPLGWGEFARWALAGSDAVASGLVAAVGGGPPVCSPGWLRLVWCG